MIKGRKVLSMILCIAMIGSLMAGCGEKEKVNSNDVKESEVQDTIAKETPKESEKETAEETANESAAEGKTETSEKIVLNLYCPGVTNQGSKDEEVLKAISDKILKDTGMDITFNLYSSSYEEEVSTVNRLIAAGELDTWMSAQTYSYIEKGLTEDLDPLMEKYGTHIKSKIDPDIYDFHRVDGKLMGLSLQSPVPAAITPLIRKDLLDKTGISVPQTMEELESAILEIKKTDPSLVGITSQIAQWIPLALFSFGGVKDFFDKDGYPIPMISTDYFDIYYEDDSLYDNLELLNRWYKEGVLNPEMFTITTDKFMDLYNRDKIICTTWGAENVTQTKDDLEKNGSKEAQWVMMDNLKTSQGLPATWGYAGAVANSIYVTKGSKNAEAFIRVLDWYCENEDNAILTLLGIKDTTYTLNDDGKAIISQDSSGGNLYYDKLGSMFYSAWSEKIGDMTKDFINDEWKKVYSMDIFSRPDCNVNYTFTKTESILTTLKTIATEYFVKMVVGDVSVEKGILEMRDALKKAKVDEYEAERQECFKKAYPNGWDK